MKACVAYPQEDFLFKILHGDSSTPPKKCINTPKVKKKKQRYIWDLSDTIETPNQPIKIKKISNKSMFPTLKV
jgi:hypothetical protein